VGLSRPSVARIPAHVAVLLGLSAGTYGLFLAGATGLQAAADRADAASRIPVADALAELVEGHDRLEANLDDALARYGAASEAYQSLVDAITIYEARIAQLAGRVNGVTAEAAGLPGSVTVATPRPVAAAAPAPATVRQVTTVTRPAATPKPVATATTGASGK
jgi:hypothetical protein